VCGGVGVGVLGFCCFCKGCGQNKYTQGTSSAIAKKLVGRQGALEKNQHFDCGKWEANAHSEGGTEKKGFCVPTSFIVTRAHSPGLFSGLNT